MSYPLIPSPSLSSLSKKIRPTLPNFSKILFHPFRKKGRDYAYWMNAPIYSVIHGILMWIYEGGLIYFNTFLRNLYFRIAGYEINSFNYRITQGLYKISVFSGFIVQECVTSKKKHFAFRSFTLHLLFSVLIHQLH